jgi:hypothetical protein
MTRKYWTDGIITLKNGVEGNAGYNFPTGEYAIRVENEVQREMRREWQLKDWVTLDLLAQII